MGTPARILIIAAVAALCITFAGEIHPESIAAFIQQYAIIAPLLFIVLCAVKPVFVFLPSFGLTIVAGTLFGTLWGTLYVVAGGALSTMVGYYFARWMGRETAWRVISRSLFFSDIEERGRTNPLRTILYLRIINLPWDAVSYWAGLSGIRFRDFYVASLIPLVPISFLYTYFGSHVFDPLSAGFIVPLAIIFLLGAVPHLHARWKRRAHA